MDAFSILARGAKLSGKHHDELKKFRQPSPAAAEAEISIDYFNKGRVGAGRRERDTPQLATKETAGVPAAAAGWAPEASRVKVTGTDVPTPAEDFGALDARIAANVAHQGYAEPTPIQREALPILLARRDLLACAPTGSGKTLAFLAPLLQLLREAQAASKDSLVRTRALIVSPTRELVSQTYETAVKLSRGTRLGVAMMDKAQMAKLRNNPGSKPAELLLSTPLRLVEAISEGLVDLTHVSTLVLDEADRLLGDEFVQQSDEIIAACTNTRLNKAVFSATLPANVEELAQSIMNSPLRVLVGHKEAASHNITQRLVYCGNEAGKLTEIRQMLKGGQVVPPILIFVQSIARAKALFHELLYDKVNVDVIHSELSQNQRDRVVANFKQGDVWVLICTDVLSRGIDFHGVNLVINYDIPLTAQAYVHRIGRTGRAGRRGEAATFFTKQDTDTVRAVANVMNQSGCEVPGWLLAPKRNRFKIPAPRDQISTVPAVVKRKKSQRHEMIEASKRRSAST